MKIPPQIEWLMKEGLVVSYYRTCRVSVRLKQFSVVILATVLLNACSPSPEERLVRAENYMAKGDYRAAILELKNASRSNPNFAAARLLLAEASYQISDLETAESEYERALGLGEDRLDVWVALGRTLVELGRAEDAFERVLPNLGDEPESEIAQVLKGDVLLILGNTADALSAYTAAIEINPESPGALIGSATIAASAGDHDRAEALIERATTTNAALAMVWRAKGNYLSVRGKNGEAADAYAKSITVESTSTTSLHRFRTRVNLTSALIADRRPDEAQQQLDELLDEYSGHPTLRYLSGRIAFLRGEFDVAQIELQEYLAQVPQDARGQALLGAVHFTRENLPEAELYLSQAVRANIGGEPTRRLLAETLLRLNKPADALAELKLSDEFDAQDPLLLSMLGRAEISLGDIDEAVRYFEEGSVADPTNRTAQLALAAAYLKGDRVDDAILTLEALPGASSRPYMREALLISAYLQGGMRDQANQQGNELLRSHPNDVEALVLVGKLSYTAGDIVRARKMFSQALEIEPKNRQALFTSGTIAIATEDFENASVLFSRLLDAHPSDVPGLVAMAAVLRREGKLEELRPRLETAIDVAPSSIEPWGLLTLLELMQGRVEEALAHVNAARVLFPGEPRLDHLEGRILLQQNRRSEAIEKLQRAVLAAPENAVYLFSLATAQRKNSEFRAAAKSARKYYSMRPNDIRGLSLLADTEIRAESPQRAEREVNDFLAENPDLAAAHDLAGDIQLSLGLPGKALRHYENAASIEWSRSAAIKIARAQIASGSTNPTEPMVRWLAEKPDDHAARFFYAQLLETAGDADLAVKEYETLYSLGKLNAVGLNNLAWQYSERGKEEAVDLARQAHDLDPDNGSISDTLGWILFRRGETGDALHYLELASKQSPRNSEIQYHLAAAHAKLGNKTKASEIISELLETDSFFPSRPDAEALAKSL